MDNLAVMASSYLTKHKQNKTQKKAFEFDSYGAASKGVLFLFG